MRGVRQPGFVWDSGVWLVTVRHGAQYVGLWLYELLHTRHLHLGLDDDGDLSISFCWGFGLLFFCRDGRGIHTPYGRVGMYGVCPLFQCVGVLAEMVGFLFFLSRLLSRQVDACATGWGALLYRKLLGHVMYSAVQCCSVELL